jgi:putative ABC transport system permease protein
VVGERDALLETLGPETRAALEGTGYQVRSPVFTLTSLPVDPGSQLQRYFNFRYEDGLAGETTLVEGSLPAPAGPQRLSVGSCDPAVVGTATCGPANLPLLDPDDVTVVSGELPSDRETVSISPASCASLTLPPDGSCAEVELPVYETAVTATTLDWLDLEIGDTVLLDALLGSGLDRGLPRSALDYALLMRISGVVELSPVDGERWMGDTQLHEPTLVPVGFTELQIFASGIMSADDYARMLDDVAPSRFAYSWRYLVDYSRVDSGNIDEIDREVRAVDLATPLARDVTQLTFRSGIDGLADDYREHTRITIALASPVLVGLGGLVAGVAVVLAALAAQRRRFATIVIRSRGAGSWRLVVARFVEGLALFVPAALVGVLAAAALSGWAVPLATIAWAAALAAGFALVFAVLFAPLALGDLGKLLAGRDAAGSAPARIVVEIMVLALGIGSVLLFRRRGLDPSGNGFDPLLAGTLLLAGLAAGVLLLRVVPYAARLASRAAGRARGLVGLVGLRGIIGRSLSARFPAVVLLTAVVLGVFGAVMSDTISAAQIEGSYQEVGANYRIEPRASGAGLSPSLDLSGVSGIEATADAAVLEGRESREGVSAGAIQILAIDLADYGEVAGGTPADPRFGEAMLRPLPLAVPGTDADPIPAIVSRDWPGGAPSPGDVIDMLIEQRVIVMVVDEVRERFPGLGPGSFMVVSREALSVAHDRLDLNAALRFVRADDSVSAELEEAVSSQQRGARLVSRPGIVDSLRASPSVVTVNQIHRLALWISALLAAMAVVTGLALTSSDRVRDFGYLRAIGLRRRQLSAATAIEQIPPAVAAIGLGLLVGIILSLFVLPQLDLTPLTGTELEASPVLPVGTLSLVCLGLLAVVGIAAAVYSRAFRELDLATLLRRGDER